MKRSLNLYLEDIRTAINKIERYTKTKSFAGFRKDEKTIDAVIRNLEIIGEAAKSIPQETKDMHRCIPWKGIIGMRNKVIHEYFGVDVEILWKTVKEDISGLKEKIEELKNS